MQAQLVLEAVQQLTGEDRLEQGSPPLMVAPPPAASMNRVYLAASATIASAAVRLPLRIFHVSGLWQYRQVSGQPERNVTKRVPGPSTPVDRSQECTEPSMGRWVAAAAGVAASFAPRSLAVRVSSTVMAFLLVSFGVSRSQGPAQREPWKVRLMTSSCCSRVRRTKFTAYPETRMVSCG